MPIQLSWTANEADAADSVLAMMFDDDNSKAKCPYVQSNAPSNAHSKLTYSIKNRFASKFVWPADPMAAYESVYPMF